MMIDERVLGAIEVGNGKLQFTLRPREQPASGVRQAVAFKDGDSFALDHLRELLPIEMEDRFTQQENLLVREYHSGVGLLDIGVNRENLGCGQTVGINADIIQPPGRKKA